MHARLGINESSLPIKGAEAMYYLVEKKPDRTDVYYVRLNRWCLCLVLFYLSEVLELTGIPWLYRRLFKKGKRPTLLEWLGRRPRWWSGVVSFPPGSKIRFRRPPRLTYSYLRKVDYSPWETRW